MTSKLQKATKEKEAAEAALKEQIEHSGQKQLEGEKQMLAKKEYGLEQQITTLQGQLGDVNKELGEARELVK